MVTNGFALKAVEEMPFVIREHARKFQWGCAKGSVWVKQLPLAKIVPAPPTSTISTTMPTSTKPGPLPED